MKPQSLPWSTRARWFLGDWGSEFCWPILRALSPLLFIAVLLLAFHWAHCVLAPTEIHPVEGTTREIYFQRRHWFGKSEHIKLEARRDENGDWQWMAQSEKTGEWSPFFRFDP